MEVCLPLIPLSTRPHRLRRSKIPEEIIEFIKAKDREYYKEVQLVLSENWYNLS